MPHPYEAYENAPLWRALDAELDGLEANGDLALTTSRAHVLGALCRRLVRQQIVTSSVALRSAQPAPVTREALASFLEDVADGRSDVGDWYRMAVTHYADALMERARHSAVQLVVALPVGAALSPAASDRIRAWASELRAATRSHSDQSTLG